MTSLLPHPYVFNQFLPKYCMINHFNMVGDVVRVLQQLLAIFAANKSADWMIRDRAANIAEIVRKKQLLTLFLVPKSVFNGCISFVVAPAEFYYLRFGPFNMITLDHDNILYIVTDFYQLCLNLAALSNFALYYDHIDREYCFEASS